MAEDIAIIDVIVPPPFVIDVVAGTKGDPGPPGPPGASSSVFFYRIDALSTGASDPGTGKLRYNAAVQADATAFYVDWLTADGFDAHLYFDLVAIGSRLVIQDKDLAVNYQTWEITGPAVNGPDWFAVPVSFVSSSGAGVFSHNQNVAVLLLSGEGATLPTAPLGQVLVSQGDGVAPVFRQDLLLVNPTALTTGSGWRFRVTPAGDLEIRKTNAAGVPETPRCEIDPWNGGFSSTYGGISINNASLNTKWLSLIAIDRLDAMASGAANTIGNLATIRDSTTNTPGAIIAGGGTFNVLARWNGTNWIVVSG
jgi:hypothetical protein